MRWTWAFGGLHGLVGSTILFLTLHPLRDALSAEALELTRVGSALEAVQGVALLVIAGRAGMRIPALLIAGGMTLWTAMLYFTVFTDLHPADVVIPIGGLVMMLGWVGLVVIAPKPQA